MSSPIQQLEVVLRICAKSRDAMHRVSTNLLQILTISNFISMIG